MWPERLEGTVAEPERVGEQGRGLRGYRGKKAETQHGGRLGQRYTVVVIRANKEKRHKEG